ncbi:LysM peptidoglycan-binding domain-containing protein, partial [Marmoricola endophyticus]|uniref:LysM peptidoglycan-binding domain-containing protein n=1 Tax=Marmoricola endophyticus TaxID=2040280 RepID=UPI00166E366F
ARPSTTAAPGASDRGRGARAPQRAAADGTVTAGTPHATGTPSATGEDTVRPGDSLWAVARRHLPPDAGPAEISRAWTAIYDANRDVVGGDPDLIHPGTDLRLPPTSEENQP